MYVRIYITNMTLEKAMSKNGNIYYKKPDDKNREQFNNHYDKNKFAIRRKNVIKRMLNGSKVSSQTIDKYDIKPIEIITKVKELCEKYPSNLESYVTNQMRFMEILKSNQKHLKNIIELDNIEI